MFQQEGAVINPGPLVVSFLFLYLERLVRNRVYLNQPVVVDAPSGVDGGG